ncbi:MAG: hypothetical protein LC745_03050, partial [Planctomycetia bacterium]|nr:hypothetical protein [Planctomycetia bacterium]
GVILVVEMVLLFLGELRPDGSKGWLVPSVKILREDLRPLLHYARGGRVPRVKVREILVAECASLQDEGIDNPAEMVLSILDGLHPEAAGGRDRPGRKVRGR